MNALERLKNIWPFAFVLLLAAALPASARTPESYGYLRVLDGTATYVQASSRESGSAEINQPVLTGDRLRLAPRSRIEVVLADRNLLRLDGGTEILFDRLAASPDASDPRTVLRLLEGNLQLVVDREALGDELPRIETPNATITIENPGTFRITAERDGWTQVVARRGSAQVESERGTARVRAGEELVIEDGQRYRPEADEAEGLDSLEQWASRLDSDYDDEDRYIQDDNLRYAARPLSRYGSWITIESRSYWRPNGVDAGWRPYWQGRWAYTPSGLTWVSYEPWGWVPYHYGSWDYLPGYGWVWTPGYSFAPAHVYWYWGNDYVGWCPTGYYTHYYGGLHASFRFGVYGWANGGWGQYRNWSFVRHDHFGGRDQARYAVPVDHLGRDGRESPGRGIITTDTRPLRPELWRKPQEAVRTLSGWQGVDNSGRTAPGKAPRQLPDVTSFIARKPRLTPTEMRPIVADNDQNALDGAALKPFGSGRPAAEANGGKPRWTQAPERERTAEENPGSAAGTPSWRKPASERPIDSPSWRKPAGEHPAESPSWRKPTGDPAAEAPSWRKPSGEPTNDAPAWRRPTGEKPADSPSWRKPSSEDRPVPRGDSSGDSGSGGWRNRQPESGREPTPTWSKPAPSGRSNGGASSPRPTYERPAPPQAERRPEPSYRPSGGSSSGGSPSSGSGGSSGWQSKPAPSGGSQREAAPRKPGGGGGENKYKGRARATRPPGDGGDGGNR